MFLEVSWQIEFYVIIYLDLEQMLKKKKKEILLWTSYEKSFASIQSAWEEMMDW